MSNRIFIEPNRGVVVSAPGHDASNPSLSDSNKIFDSNWFAAGQVVMARVVRIDLPPYAHHQFFDTMYEYDLGYIPHTMAFVVNSGMGPMASALVNPVNLESGYIYNFGSQNAGVYSWGPTNQKTQGSWQVTAMSDRVRFTSNQHVNPTGFHLSVQLLYISLGVCQ